jgi:hypothetical protein
VTSLWRDFRLSRESLPPAPSATDAAARRLTSDGYIVSAPRVGEDGAVYYRRANADGFPALIRLENGVARRLAWRVGGGRTSVHGNWVVFDQLEYARSVAFHSDLYAMPRAGGRVVRLTKDARARLPRICRPDGRRIACVVEDTGWRALAILDFAPGGPRARCRP